MGSFFKRHSDTVGILMGAVIFVGLGFMAQRLLEWDRTCLKFSGVIELHVDGFVEGVRGCRATSRFESQHYSDEITALVQKINELHSLEMLFPKSLRGVFVTVTKKDPFFMLFSERSLVIGEEIAKSPQGLQRAVLSAVAFQSFAGEDTIEKELRADLLWYLFAGDSRWQDASLGVSVDPKRWMKLAGAPRTVEDYCANPLRQIYDLSFCRYELDRKQMLPLRKRYQSVVAWTAYRALEKMGQSFSTHYLRSLFDSQVAVNSQRIPVEADEEQMDSIDTIEGFVREEVRRFLTPPTSAEQPFSEDEELDQTISSLWKPLAIASVGDFRFVVQVDDEGLKDVVVNSLTEWQKNSLAGFHAKILVVGPDEQLELPLLQKVNYTLDQVRSDTHLVLACNLPELRTIASLQAVNLVAMKVCNSTELPQWAEILSEGSNAKFASLRLHLHVPSLKRWVGRQPEILASNLALDRVFCDPKTTEGYPFTAENCPKRSR